MNLIPYDEADDSNNPSLSKESIAFYDPGLSTPITRRSWQWSPLRIKVVTIQPWCSVCGGIKNLNVHHIKPFHLYSELELDPNNFIVLCEGWPGRMASMNCHFVYGHLGRSWSSFNPGVVTVIKPLRVLFGVQATPYFPRKEMP